MKKGDWKLIILLIIILVLLALFTSNINTIFPTPTVQEAMPTP